MLIVYQRTIKLIEVNVDVHWSYNSAIYHICLWK